MSNSNYNTIIKGSSSTVVSEYVSAGKKSTHYQSEDELEKEFIERLEANGYEYINIKKEEDLINNLRVQLSKFNNYEFSENEWQQILRKYLTNKTELVEDKAEKIQDDYIFDLRCDDGSTKNIHIIDKDKCHQNIVQVINQYEAEGTKKNRYDVTILINGLPMVHIELKRRGVSIREAFNQIKRYERESFWADSKLFEYVQLFVISNGTHTKYYSNTTRYKHIRDERRKRKKSSNSFEFTSWWADANNKRIPDLVDFSKTFFSKHSLLSILTKYCVFTADKELLVMRPYQIVAAERIVNRIEMYANCKKLGTIDAGGYIWHTTGSGKTLTSFKTAQIATKIEGVEKVLFIVDRKDLDYQTMKEYDKFQEGAANSNTSTEALKRQLSDANAKIIITTIQKLSRFIDKNKKHEIFGKHVVLIFDECHRSQFGEMHTAITKSFKKYNIFGFTGTPIFAINTSAGNKPMLKTTEQAFGKQLHQYTIVNAINDRNVLPFRVDYLEVIKEKEIIKDKKVAAIDKEAVFKSPKYISAVTDYIVEHFDQKTKRDQGYSFNKLKNIPEVAANKEKGAAAIREDRKETRLKGFNSIFAVSSIEAAKKYYEEFKAKKSRLKVATIFSYAPNEEENEDGILIDEEFETDGLDKTSRDFLEGAIGDYNKMFKTNYDTSSDKFQNYYKDISQRMKNREIDILIVVNMFLTGFDATTLNTLWVDKNLRHHGLIQAFSRTNRILNSVKTFGNIVCFRNLEKNTNEAISIFGNKDACGIVLLKTFKEYYNGWEEDGKSQKGYTQLIAELKQDFPLPIDGAIIGEQAEKDFIKLWGAILRLRNILTAFDEFAENEILAERDIQDYKSYYIDLYEKLRKHQDADKENVNDDIEFEIELVKQVNVTIDFILQLVAQYHKMKDEKILTAIEKEMDADFELRSKKELIMKFIETLNAKSDVYKDWQKFAEKSKAEELEKIIAEEDLKPEKAKKFVANAFRDETLRSTGTEFAEILPPMSMFDKNNLKAKKRQTVFERLKAFFEKYLGI